MKPPHFPLLPWVLPLLEGEAHLAGQLVVPLLIRRPPPDCVHVTKPPQQITAVSRTPVRYFDIGEPRLLQFGVILLSEGEELFGFERVSHTVLIVYITYKC